MAEEVSCELARLDMAIGMRRGPRMTLQHQLYASADLRQGAEYSPDGGFGVVGAQGAVTGWS